MGLVQRPAQLQILENHHRREFHYDFGQPDVLLEGRRGSRYDRRQLAVVGAKPMREGY